MSISAQVAPIRSGSALRKLTLTEGKLLLREPIALFWAVVFPMILMVVMGLVSSTPDPALGGRRLVETYQPILIAFVTAALAVQGLPAVLAGYRERGILRRLATTPVGSHRVLAAQLAVNLAVALIATLGIIVVGKLAFHTDFPRQWPGFLLALLLLAASMLTLGLLMAAVAPTGRSANAIGAIVFFPMMFFAGLWLPRALMSPVLRRISDFTPLGAAVRALQAAMVGDWPPVSALAVLAGSTIVFGAVAARLFRWE
ncbi:MAG: ABC transporter permease [Sciscionella sp.]